MQTRSHISYICPTSQYSLNYISAYIVHLCPVRGPARNRQCPSLCNVPHRTTHTFTVNLEVKSLSPSHDSQLNLRGKPNFIKATECSTEPNLDCDGQRQHWNGMRAEVPEGCLVGKAMIGIHNELQTCKNAGPLFHFLPFPHFVSQYLPI